MTEIFKNILYHLLIVIATICNCNFCYLVTCKRTEHDLWDQTYLCLDSCSFLTSSVILEGYLSVLSLLSSLKNSKSYLILFSAILKRPCTLDAGDGKNSALCPSCRGIFLYMWRIKETISNFSHLFSRYADKWPQLYG